MTTDTDAWLMNDNPSNSSVDCNFEDSFTPFEHLPDSATYISSLETKLEKLKGKNGKESKPCDLVRGLEATRGQHMRELVLQTEQLETLETVTENATRMNVPTMFRRLCPEKQALSEEELQRLLLADELARIAAQLQAAEKEKKDEQINKPEV